MFLPVLTPVVFNCLFFLERQPRLHKYHENVIKSCLDSSTKGYFLCMRHVDYISTHILQDICSLDQDKFRMIINGTRSFTLQDLITEGTYNCFLDGSNLYDTTRFRNEESNDLFKKAMPEGFAWEILDVFSGINKTFCIIYFQSISVPFSDSRNLVETWICAFDKCERYAMDCIDNLLQ